MELLPKMIAAADMCEAGEEVNLDELAFLFRYAVDELDGVEEAYAERDSLLENLRERVIARCDLLDRGEHDLARAKEGTLEELQKLDDELDREIKQRYSGNGEAPFNATGEGNSFDLEKYRSG
ncbi:MAG: hypothetical protein P9L92_18770 [Candidatus Electryonea clarkiae]|nr:hypothetical protein [Candidatus Electryonea clarkiae]MDP8287843.1 hypothetical protein [Candidatus Electryonea clarkiae]